MKPANEIAWKLAVEEVCDRFDRTWTPEKSRDIRAYCDQASADCSDARHSYLALELCKIDLERWLGYQAGNDTVLADGNFVEDMVRVERYFELFPKLLVDETFVGELICWEYRLRRLANERVDSSEFHGRFKDYQENVGQLLELAESELVEDLQTAQGDKFRLQLRSTGFSVRCPGCRERLLVKDTKSLSNLTCSKCNQSVSVSRNRDVPTRLGRFDLLEEVGFGGFGTVWRAKDTELDRVVALKFPNSAVLNEETKTRFLNEAKAAAPLNHPGIVGVFDAIEEDDHCFIVTEFVDGKSMAEWLGSAQLSPRESAEMCVKICDALCYAHENGIVHRDLKPGNIIIDQSGQPKIADFGLAKRTSDDVAVTMEGVLLGTPAYTSPEQARGDAHLADERSDIYSVGVLLYELMTGELPFRGTLHMTLDQVQNAEPVSPRKLHNQIPLDLETICLKCLEKKPGRRYDSARDLEDDLSRYLANRPIKARPVGPLVRAMKWMRRNPVATIAVVLGILAAFTAFESYSLTKKNQLQQAENEIQQAENDRQEAVNAIWESNEKMNAAKELRQSETPGRKEYALELLSEASLVQENASSIQQVAVLAMGDMLGKKPLSGAVPAAEAIRCVDFNESDRIFAVGTDKGNVYFYDSENGERLDSLEALDNGVLVRGVHLRGNSQEDLEVTVVGDDRRVVSYQREACWLEDTDCEFTLPGTQIHEVDFSMDGSSFAVHSDSAAGIYDIETQQLSPLEKPEDAEQLCHIALSHDERLVALGYDVQGGGLCSSSIFDLEIEGKKETIHGTSLTFRYCGDFDERGKFYAFGNGMSEVFSLDTSRVAMQLDFGTVYTVEFRPRSNHLAVLYTSGRLLIADPASRQVLERLDVGPRNGVQISDRGSKLAVTGGRNWAVYDLVSPERTDFRGHDNGVPALAYLPSGDELVSVGLDNTVKRWSLVDGQEERSPIRLKFSGQAIAVDPTGRFAAVASIEGHNDPILIIDLESQQILDEIQHRLNLDGDGDELSTDYTGVGGIAFLQSDDRLGLAACGAEGTAIWDLAIDGNELEAREVERFSWPANGQKCRQLVATGSIAAWCDWTESGAKVRVWDYATRTELDVKRPVLGAGTDTWFLMAMSKTGKLVYADDGGRHFAQFDTETRTAGPVLCTRSSLRGLDVELSHDGRLHSVRVASDEIAIRDTETDELIVKLPKMDAEIWFAAWNPTRYEIAISDNVGNIRVWNLEEVDRQLRQRNIPTLFPWRIPHSRE